MTMVEVNYNLEKVWKSDQKYKRYICKTYKIAKKMQSESISSFLKTPGNLILISTTEIFMKNEPFYINLNVFLNCINWYYKSQNT